MRGFLLGLLYTVGLLGTVVVSGVLIYRAILFSTFTSATLFAVFGVVLALYSAYKMVAMLHQATIHALENRQGLLWEGPLVLVAGAAVSSLLAIHFAGLGVGGFFTWIGNQFGQWLG